MYLYHLTLQNASSIPQTVVGNFTGASKAQEILAVRGTSVLELMKIDPNTGRIKTIVKQNLFCIIRSVVPFRLPGDHKGMVQF